MDVAGWNPYVEMAGPVVHGIFADNNGGFDLHVSDVWICNCTGSGIKDTGAPLFQWRVDNSFVQNCAGNGFELFGGSASSYTNCSGGGFGQNKSLFRVYSGNVVIDGCAGMHGWASKTYCSGTEPKNSWGTFGDAVNAAFPLIRNCNIEAFTEYGCFFFGSSAANFERTTFFHDRNASKAGMRCRALHYNSCESTRLSRMDAACQIILGVDAQWGDPNVSTSDGKAIFYAAGAAPFLVENASLAGLAANPLGAVPLPSASTTINYYQHPAVAFSSTQTDYAGTRSTKLTATATLDSMYGTVALDASSGSFFVDLPLLGQSLSQSITFVVLSASTSSSITLRGYDDGTNKQPIVSQSRGGSNTTYVLNSSFATVTLTPGSGGIGGGQFSWYVTHEA
jgi:hypothetical protein